MIQPGQKYLITCDRWFFAPDGEQYKAAFGTVHTVVDAKSTLGIETNRNSTNWYVVIGDMIIAGCQIHYAMRADSFDPKPPVAEVDYNGERMASQCSVTRIYNANSSGLMAYGGDGAKCDRAENNQLRKALEFYADPKTYDPKCPNDLRFTVIPDSDITRDSGKKARMTLAGINTGALHIREQGGA